MKLRSPEPVFAGLGAAILFVLGLLLAAWAGSGFLSFQIAAAQALALPVALATALACLALLRRFKSGEVASRFGVVWRAASAFGAIGFAWPLSFGLTALLQGDVNTALIQCVAALATTIVGVAVGALAGLAAAFICTQTPAS